MISLYFLTLGQLTDKPRKFLCRFVNANVYSVKHSIVDKNREDQSVLVQDLMLELSNKYNEVFPPANAGVEQTYLEGVENCVCKNLYGVLFGENGVGSH